MFDGWIFGLDIWDGYWVGFWMVEYMRRLEMRTFGCDGWLDGWIYGMDIG